MSQGERFIEMLNRVIKFGKQLLQTWDEDKPARLAAGLAYYSLFSLAPILYIAIEVAGIFFDEAELATDMFNKLELVLGADAVATLQNALVTLNETTTSGNLITTMISIGALLFAASGLFANLKYGMNTIWNVPPSEYSGLMALIRTRLISFAIVIGLGLFLVLLSVTGIFISILDTYLQLERVINFLSIATVYVLSVIIFGLFYIILPDTKVKLRDVWGGAIFSVTIIAAVLWVVVTLLGGLSFTSPTGAAGAVAVILLSVYYVAQIFLLGAEFTKVYAYQYGSRKNQDKDRHTFDEGSE